MQIDEKIQAYASLGVISYIENAILNHKSQYNKLPIKIILGQLEWKLCGLDKLEDYKINEVLCTCNSNSESGIIMVHDKV
jgi:hypothetical protein